jgi:hypothetical protein
MRAALALLGETEGAALAALGACEEAAVGALSPPDLQPPEKARRTGTYVSAKARAFIMALSHVRAVLRSANHHAPT